MSTLYPDGGFTKFPNSLRNAPWRNKPLTVAVYTYLRLKASHFTNGWNGIVLEPGQLIAGRKAIAEDVGLTEQEVRTAINHLKTTGYITAKSTNKFTIYSFIDKENWMYERNISTNQSSAIPPTNPQQNPQQAPRHIPSSSTNKQPTTNQQATNNQPHKETIENKRQGEGGEEDAAAAAALDNVNELIRRYGLSDSEATLEALLEDADAHGFDTLEAALKKASQSDNRGGISVNFYRSILRNNGQSKQTEDCDPYAGVPVFSKA